MQELGKATHTIVLLSRKIHTEQLGKRKKSTKPPFVACA